MLNYDHRSDRQVSWLDRITSRIIYEKNVDLVWIDL